jgi:hypothetical protein
MAPMAGAAGVDGASLMVDLGWQEMGGLPGLVNIQKAIENGHL